MGGSFFAQKWFWVKLCENRIKGWPGRMWGLGRSQLGLIGSDPFQLIHPAAQWPVEVVFVYDEARDLKLLLHCHPPRRNIGPGKF